MGKSEEGTVTVARPDTGTSERLGHITGSIPWRYPAKGQVNLEGTVAP